MGSRFYGRVSGAGVRPGGVVVAALVAACARPEFPRPPAEPSVRFAAISLDEASDEWRASPSVMVGETAHGATWRPLMTVGQDVGGRRYGAIVDQNGDELENSCSDADFGVVFDAAGATWHLGHLECQPGALWLTKLDVGAEGLTPVSAAPVDLSGVGGAKDPCAGTLTPWGSVLSGEEYETNARRYATRAPDPRWDQRGLASYRKGARPPRPYDFGWMIETKVTSAEGGTEVAKHYAMGRYSHESAVVMPDRRTVYLTDDETNAGLFLFVADTADDLSAGHLYAMRWEQTSAEDGGAADVVWVPLGHATDAQVAGVLADGTVRFDDLIEAFDPGEACPAGTLLVAETGGRQCLRIRLAADRAVVTRAEARRTAALFGATTELRKGEGIVHDPWSNRLFVAFAEVNNGMEDGHAEWDVPDANHVRLPANPCGGVYAATLDGGVADRLGAPIDSAFVATSIRGFWMGVPEGEGCATSGPANPDNLALLPGALLVAEDSRLRTNYLWSVDLTTDAPVATPIFAATKGAEVTASPSPAPPDAAG